MPGKPASDATERTASGPSASAPKRKEACGGGYFVHPPARRRVAKGIICSLPDIIDRMACSDDEAPIDGDREGANFFATAHDPFIFDESDVDMASSVDFSEGSSPSESFMGDHSEEASPGKASDRSRASLHWPKLLRLVGWTKRTLLPKTTSTKRAIKQ
ncbi:hypothetical protein WJX73_008248 [Symbiochloris irregularis]|uniref:Uncharacterized protein n=1 Tax=Symbiochloris irregularis TaxID=706552 RepID=A0AAW1P1G6_9CHLO